MSAITLSVNGQSHTLEVDPSTPLLWVLRDNLGMTGTKYGCGIAQCGYCQSGMLMAAAALLKQVKKPTDEDIDAYVSNICRCGTYPRVRAAIHRASGISS
jgi:isoquinoline 1-oxidoreductase alpha subunit